MLLMKKKKTKIAVSLQKLRVTRQMKVIFADPIFIQKEERGKNVTRRCYGRTEHTTNYNVCKRQRERASVRSSRGMRCGIMPLARQ